MTPFFTIVVPVYNHAKYVGLALDSLLAQADSDWEACVVDDGSTDGSSEILDDYARRDERIRVFHQANGGQAAALNASLRAARGQWICWLSSDDLFDPHKLAVHRQWIGRFPAHRYFFSKFRVLDDATGRITPSDQGAIPAREWQILDLLSYNYINGITLCIHRETFHEKGMFDDQNRYGQDYDLHLRMLTRYEAVHIPEETCISRVHSSQFSRTENRSMFYDCASAAIGFLNKTSFAEYFPLLDLREASHAFRAVDRSLDVAMSPAAYVNQLGPHPLLVGRILEWVWRQPGPTGRRLRALVEWRVMAAATRSEPGSRWGAFWRAAALLVAGNPVTMKVTPCTPVEAADAALADLSAQGDAEAESVRRFIAKRQGREPHAPPAERRGPRDVVVEGEVGDEQVRILAQRGWRITRVHTQSDGLLLHEWGWTVGVHSARRSLPVALAAVPLWDAAVVASGRRRSLALASRTEPVMGEQGDAKAMEHLKPAGCCARVARRVRGVQWRVQRALMR